LGCGVIRNRHTGITPAERQSFLNATYLLAGATLAGTVPQENASTPKKGTRTCIVSMQL
jgi:hypothetical protein